MKRLEQLREVLVGPEQSRLETLEDRPPADADAVGSVLPEAVAKATSAREQELAIALEPTMTRAVAVVARRRPELFGEILAPSIGAAVRKAVSDALAAMMERFNEALEQSLSVRAVRWRVEAARTGRPFAEVVLLHTLRYRVEQVLLIHTETSLVLQHVIAPEHPAESPDQIAAMLSAIDSFGREALVAPPDAHLDRFEFGDLTVWVSRDAALTLAAIVRGSAAAEIGPQLDEVRERIRLRCAEPLERFSRDVTPFMVARDDLEPLVRTERMPPARRAHIWLGIAALAIVLASIGLVLLARVHRAADARLRAAYVEALASEPGIVVTSAEWSGGRGRFAGLRDPLSPAPEAILARRGLGPTTTTFEPFVSLDPRIEQRRAERVLAPPPGVTPRIEAGALRVAGTAPRAWIDAARLLGRSLPGVERYDDGALRSKESVEGLRAVGSELETATIPFRTGQSRIPREAASTLGRVAASVTRAEGFATEARMAICLEIIGHADAPGSVDRNQALSAERAATVAADLTSRGVDGRELRTVGTGVWESGGARARSVMFHLSTREDASRPGCEGAE